SPLAGTKQDSVQARQLLGQAYLGKYRTAEAIAQFQRAIELNPKMALNHYFLGRAYAAQGDKASAQRSYQQALALDPGMTPAKRELAAISGQQTDEKVLAGEVQSLQKALEKDPTNIGLRYALAVALLASKQAKEAEDQLQRILQTAPGYV